VSVVAAVHRDDTHRFSKRRVEQIRLRAGWGVEGDAHAGGTVAHLSRVRRDPTAPNLRQLHLLAGELLDELLERGFEVAAGNLGENITTRGLDLLAVPTGTRLRLGADAMIDVTGLRNPCRQLDRFQSGLQRAVVDRAPDGTLVRRAGIMAVVVRDGTVRVGDAIEVTLPDPPHQPLQPV
jgi:hypothetical protein